MLQPKHSIIHTTREDRKAKGYGVCVNPLDVVSHLRPSLRPLTVIVTVAALSMILYVYRRLRTGFDPHSYPYVHLALHFLDDIDHDGPSHHPLFPLVPDLGNFRGPVAVGGHHHLARTVVPREHQLVRRLTLFLVS